MGKFPVNRLSRSLRRISAYEVGRLACLSSGRPYIFYLSFRSEALRKVGVLERITKTFAERGIPILQLKVSTPLKEGELRAIIIADLAGHENLALRLVGELEKIPTVMRVSFEPPIVNGLAVDSSSFPLQLVGERAIIMRKVVYDSLIRGGWRRLGSGYGQLLYLIGFEIGKSTYRSHLNIARRDPSLVVDVMARIFQLVGYGIVDVVELDDSGFRAVVRVYDSFECELFRGVGEIRGNLVRGMLAGWLAERWGGLSFDQVTAREVKCIARGDPHCEYHITGRKQGS